MTAKSVVTTITTGEFTAKIEKQRDFKATQLYVFFDGEYFHISGQEGQTPTPADDYRLLYIHVKKEADTLKFHKLYYTVKADGDTKKYFADSGTFTIDFDETKRHYKMSFHVVARFGIETADILGSFDLEVS